MAEPTHVVIAGGGVAALETLMALRDLAGDRVAVTLVAPGTSFIEPPDDGRAAVHRGACP